MTPAQLKLARRRLWLGITNLGFWVLAACVGLWWLVMSRADAPSPQLIFVIGVGAVAGQALFDFIGGALLVPEPRPTMSAFLPSWSRGLISHMLVMVVVGLLSYASFRLSGGFCSALLLATVGLALGRRPLFRALTGVSTQEVSLGGGTILTADPTDPAFTGGIVGLGRRARSLLPARWLVVVLFIWRRIQLPRRSLTGRVNVTQSVPFTGSSDDGT